MLFYIVKLLSIGSSILLTEAYSPIYNVIKYYGRQNECGEIIEKGAQVPFFLKFIRDTNSSFNAREFGGQIIDYINQLPKGKNIQPNWQVRYKQGAI